MWNRDGYCMGCCCLWSLVVAVRDNRRHVFCRERARVHHAAVDRSLCLGGCLQVAYGASKAALNQVTRVMAVEWGRSGIRVNAVAPGVTLTKMGRDVWDSPAMVCTVPLESKLCNFIFLLHFPHYSRFLPFTF
jgi:hypothetical protein